MKIIENLKSMLHARTDGNSASEVVAQSFSSLDELKVFIAEQRRLRGLRNSQSALRPSLNADIAALEGQRIKLLTESIIEASDEKSARARELEEQITGKQKQLADIDLVVASIDEKIVGLNDERAKLERQYLRDLGQFMDGIYAELADEYTRKATEIADVLYQIMALRNVMLFYKTGRTGTIDARFFLPGIVPGESKSLKPIIDFSTPDFVNGVRGFEGSIHDKLTQAGFINRFD